MSGCRAIRLVICRHASVFCKLLFVVCSRPFQDYPHPDDHTTRSTVTVTPGFKTFTVVGNLIKKSSAHHFSKDSFEIRVFRNSLKYDVFFYLK